MYSHSQRDSWGVICILNTRSCKEEKCAKTLWEREGGREGERETQRERERASNLDQPTTSTNCSLCRSCHYRLHWAHSVSAAITTIIITTATSPLHPPPYTHTHTHVHNRRQQQEKYQSDTRYDMTPCEIPVNCLCKHIHMYIHTSYRRTLPTTYLHLRPLSVY